MANGQLNAGKGEKVAFQSAWSAVSRQYAKPEGGGKWVHKVKNATLYGHRKVENAAEIIKWAKAQGFDTTQVPSDMHVTIAYSTKAVDWPEQDDDGIVIRNPSGRAVKAMGDKGAVALTFKSATLSRRHEELCKVHGCSWDFEDYTPHVTLTWQAGDMDLDVLKAYDGEIHLGPEVFDEVEEDWSDDIVEKTEVDLTILKVNKKLGLIFGWAIVCKQNGEEYYDTQGDHIPEESMLNAAADFMAKQRTMKLMHKGKEQGKILFAWPLTTETAKSMGIQSPITGLMIAAKPDNDEIIEAAEKGELTGFSIGGERIEDEEVD